MPLSVKARIEIYLPDVPKPVYRDLQARFAEEFSYTWGGCSLIQGVVGYYRSQDGAIVQDKINLLFTDTLLNLDDHPEVVAAYADNFRTIAFRTLNEEAILVAVVAVRHSVI